MGETPAAVDAVLSDDGWRCFEMGAVDSVRRTLTRETKRQREKPLLLLDNTGQDETAKTGAADAQAPLVCEIEYR